MAITMPELPDCQWEKRIDAVKADLHRIARWPQQRCAEKVPLNSRFLTHPLLQIDTTVLYHECGLRTNDLPACERRAVRNKQVREGAFDF